MAILFHFDREDTDNFRVYYRGGEKKQYLYCIQNDGIWDLDIYVFYICTKDGEPLHPIRMPLLASFDKKIMPPSIIPQASSDECNL